MALLGFSADRKALLLGTALASRVTRRFGRPTAARSTAGQIGILATTFAYTPCGCGPYYGAYGDGGNVTVVNSGPIAAPFAGILATAGGNNATVSVINQGKITSDLIGIFAATGIDTYFDCGCSGSTLPYFEPSGFGDNSPVFVVNSGEIDPAVGILAFTGGNNSPIDIQNSGKIAATFAGIAAASYGANSGIHIVNSGEITTTGGAGYGAIPIVPNVGYSVAIAASTVGAGSNIVVENSGEVNGKGKFGVGIAAYTPGAGSSQSDQEFRLGHRRLCRHSGRERDRHDHRQQRQDHRGLVLRHRRL